MSATEEFSIILLISVVVISALGTLYWLQQKRRRRALVELAHRPCPRCGQMLGIEATRHATTRSYLWTVTRGHNVRELDLPSETLTILCPRCKAELDFRLDGRLFEEVATTGPAASGH